MALQLQARRATLFANMPLTLNSVSFTYPAQEKPVFERLTLTFDKGWTGIVGAHRSGKTTLLNLMALRLSPTSGVIKTPGKVLCCQPAIDVAPAGLARALAHADGPSAELFGRLSLGSDWLERWATLSPGERKRAQVACALLESPDVLLLDEPTSQADMTTRELLAGVMARYRGIGLLASDDRELLDRLCRACVLLEQGTATLRAGTYSQVREHANRDQEIRNRQKGNAARQHAALSAEVAKRRDAASSANDKRSKRSLDKHDSDGRFRLNLARRSGKDGQAGKLLKQLEGRLHQAESRVAELDAHARPPLDAQLAGVPAAIPSLLHLQAQDLPFGTATLKLPELRLAPTDRIAISGPASSGKTGLVKHLLAHLDLASPAVAYLPQWPDASNPAKSIAPDHLEIARTALACLGASPDRLLQMDKPAAAELRQLALAIALTRKPNLVVLDEPTLGMDMPSIEAMEDCLSQLKCALILVSQDPVLLRRLCPIRWQIAGSGGKYTLEVSPWPAA